MENLEIARSIDDRTPASGTQPKPLTEVTPVTPTTKIVMNFPKRIEYLVLDIETVPLPRELVHPFLLAKIEEQAKKARNEDKKNIDTRMALDPDFGQIIAIGMLDSSEAEPTLFWQEENLKEPSILDTFWQAIEIMNPEVLVTFNGKRFDWPYIVRRSALNNIKPTKTFPTKRYYTFPHFDVLEVLSNFDFYEGKKLSEYSKIFKIDHKVTGADVYRLWQEGNLGAIIDHLKSDLLTTRELYLRIRDYYD